MSKRPSYERDVRALTKACKRHEAQRRRHVADRHRALLFRQRAERELLKAQLRGVEPPARQLLLDALALKHKREHRDLDETIRASERADRASEPAPASIPWSPLPPRAARALRDQQSLTYWNETVASLTDNQLIDWLRVSHKRVLQRPLGVPEFDDLTALEAVRERIDKIRASRDTALQRRLQQALVPTTRGRRHKDIDRRDLSRAQELRGILTGRLQQAQSGSPSDYTYRSRVDEILKQTLPSWPPTKRTDFLNQIGSKSMKPSEAAARIAGRHYHLPFSRVRQGKAPKAHRARRRRIVVAVKNLEAVEHARERRRRGQRKRATKAE